MKRLWGLVVIMGGLVRPAQAYVDATPTLGRLVKDAPHIVVLRVQRVSLEKRVILFAKVADLKGNYPQQEVKQHIGDEGPVPERRVIMDWAELGKIAIGFHNGKVFLTCPGNFWYECAPRAAPWWALTRARPELSLAYFGSPYRLRDHIAALLAGKDATITAIRHNTRGSHSYDDVAFRTIARGVDAPLWRITASLDMPGTVDGLVNNEELITSYDAGGPQDVPDLVQELRADDRWVRAEAALALGRIGEPAVAALPALRRAVQGVDKWVRIRAAAALHKIDPQDKAALTALVRELHDPSPGIRRAAAESVGELGADADAAVPALDRATRDTDPGARGAAVEALGRVGSAKAVPALLAALQDHQVRFVAVNALGALGADARAASPALIHLLHGTDSDLRWCAALALVRINVGSQDVTIARATAPLFIAALKSKDPKTRWQAMWCLSLQGAKAKYAFPALVRLLRDESDYVRAAAQEALERIGTDAQSAVPALAQLLEDKDVGVRLAVARLLWRIAGDAQAGAIVPVLKAALEDKDEQVRTLAAYTLDEIGPVAAARATAGEAFPAAAPVSSDAADWAWQLAISVFLGAVVVATLRIDIALARKR
jgi:HEAT repeat protein